MIWENFSFIICYRIYYFWMLRDYEQQQCIFHLFHGIFISENSWTLICSEKFWWRCMQPNGSKRCNDPLIMQLHGSYVANMLSIISRKWEKNVLFVEWMNELKINYILLFYSTQSLFEFKYWESWTWSFSLSSSNLCWYHVQLILLVIVFYPFQRVRSRLHQKASIVQICIHVKR